jgi:hypothetical protein
MSFGWDLAALAAVAAATLGCAGYVLASGRRRR